MKNIANIAVGSIGYGNDRASVSWDAEGAHFHIWINLPGLDLQRALGGDPPCIYKNPPKEVEYKGAGWFRTRFLDASIPKNAAVIAHVLDVVRRENMIEQALAAKVEDDAEKQRKHEEAVLANRIREAGPELLKALEDARAALADIRLNGAGCRVITNDIDKIDEAIKNATKGK